MSRTFRCRTKLEVFYSGGPIQLSSDGSRVACACLQDTKVVDCVTGSVVKTIEGDGELVTALCFTPDGKYIYIASRSLIVRKICMESGECLGIFRGNTAPVSDISVDPSGSVVAFGSADRTVTVFDVEGNYRTHTFKGHKEIILKVLFHPTEAELLSCGMDNKIKVWNLHQSKLRTTLSGHNSAVTSLDFSEDGKYLVSAGRDNSVVVWTVRNYSKCLEFPVFEAVEDLLCLPSSFAEKLDKRRSKRPCLVIATGGERGKLRIWRSDQGSEISEESKKEHSGITSLQSIEGNRLLVGKSDCTLEFLQLEDRLANGQLKISVSRYLIGNMDEITDLCFVDTEASRLAVASNSPFIQIFNSADLNCIGILDGHSEAVLCIYIAYFESRPVLISGSKDQKICVWDVSSMTKIGEATGHAAAVTSVSASQRECKMVASVSADRLIKIWKLKLKSVGDRISLEKLKVTSGVVGHSKDINCVDISPNDALTATGSVDKTIKIFSVPSLTLQSTLKGHKRGVWSVKFSPVEKMLLSGSADMTIKLWSLTDSSCLRTFEGHSGSILKAIFLSQSQVLSCGGDGLVKLWKVSNCECINTFDDHDDRIWSISLSSDKQFLASGGSDSRLIIWRDTTESDRQLEVIERQAELSKQQDLSNAIQLRDFALAARLAFELDRPRQLLALLKKHLSRSDHLVLFSALVDCLHDDQRLKQCLEYIREWNTNAKHAEEANMLLRMIFERISPQKLISIPGISGLIEGIESYSVRHFNRLQKLHQSTYVVDYLLNSINAVLSDLLDA